MATVLGWIADSITSNSFSVLLIATLYRNFEMIRTTAVGIAIGPNGGLLGMLAAAVAATNKLEVPICTDTSAS